MKNQNPPGGQPGGLEEEKIWGSQQVESKPSQPENPALPEPVADASNLPLVCFLKAALACPNPTPSGRPNQYRNWTWPEVVEEMGWTGEFLAGATRLAQELGLIPSIPKTRICFIPDRRIRPAPKWAPPPEPPPRPKPVKRRPAKWMTDEEDRK